MDLNGVQFNMLAVSNNLIPFAIEKSELQIDSPGKCAAIAR